MQKKHIKNIIIIFIIIIILELTIFNVNSYRILNSEKSKTYNKKDFNCIEKDEFITLIEIPNINEEIKTLNIEVENYNVVDYKLLYTDETTAEYLELPVKTYVDDLQNSKYIATFLSRKK